MTVQAIRPAGAGHETRVVLAVCIIIVMLATLTIVLRTTQTTVAQVQAHQVDARHGLTAAEQGVYADLLVAADEIGLAPTVPDVNELATQMIPPFATDVATARRGGHEWHMKQDGAIAAYIGVTHQPDTASSMLLRVTRSPDADGHAAPDSRQTQVWLYKGAQAQAQMPATLDPGSLVQAGWQEIVSQFDVGATRHQP
ncbi:hypothetical protein CAP48_08605 [Advenella sp. S44]|uniref:DUF6162 family protein n=1 Tax=Advenella sp. S44 TaxID=1982755 RepID=UPI000C2B4FB0|nr:DUF6162 family protein [Advenella sp. S44]PJX26066.1 hypothetical protein CAP48_08605 [Advenella sp. S44]